MRSTNSVILLIPAAREFDRGLRRGIIDYGNRHGPWTFFEEAPPYLQSLTPRQRLREMSGWKAHGAIVLQSRYREVMSLNLPTVIAVETRKLDESYNQVVCDNVEIGRMGARVLIGLGLRHFAYCGLAGLEFSDNRGAGFRKALEDANRAAAIYNSKVASPGLSWYSERKKLASWLMSLPKPVGLMACNDDRARMVIDICRSQQLRVPDDVAVLGVDNDEQVCRSASPPLSSIALATEAAGFEAAALLAELMAGHVPARRTVIVRASREVIRQSTDTLAHGDSSLVRALRFIRDNCSRDMRVSEVADAAGLSRRALQDRFVRELGRTAIEEIHRRRADHVARLLLETNMTVGEIAYASGFDMGAHLARFFARCTGLTPRAYRQMMRIS